MGTTLRLDAAGLGTLVTPARALCARRSGLGLRSRYRLNMLRPSATGPDGNGGKEESSPGPGMSEDVMARLKKAELEAAELRKQLEAVQGTDGTPAVPATPKRRIDSAGFRRETLFNKDAQDNWLKESQAVDLLVGSGPGERGSELSEEAQGVVQRRLLIGVAASVGLAAFALVPTENFRPRPSKPLFFYLTAVLRVQAHLKDLEALVADAEFDRVKSVLSRMLGSPGDIKSNLENSVAWLDDVKTRETANALAFEFLEYLQQVDYSKYFENMRTATPSGADKARYSEFSVQCVKAAQSKLNDFLKLMPAEDLDAARQQANAATFGGL